MQKRLKFPRMNKTQAILGLFVTTLLCASFFASAKTFAVAQDGETFVMAFPSDIGELNPLFYRSQRSEWYDMLVYDTLVAFDENLEPIPWLAESWDVSPDGKQITFTIRSGVKWHDGEDLTPDDVKFSFEYWKSAPADANLWAFMQHMESATVDGQKVIITMDQTFSFVLQNLGGEIYILPKHVREGIAHDSERWDDADDVAAHTGSGPFKFNERVEDEFTSLMRFEDWWGKDVFDGPWIKEVRIDVIRGQDNRILAMKAGDADTERYEVFGPYVNQLLLDPDIDVVLGLPSQWDYVLGFNVTYPGLDDIRVRTAMAHAIDREGLTKIGRLGWGTPTYSVIPEAFYPSFYDPAGAFWDADVDGANQILDEAGYLDTDGDGIREFPGATKTPELRFELPVLSWDDISVDTGAGLELQMSRIGIKLDVTIMDDAVMYPYLYELPRQYQMYCMSHGYTSVPDHVWFRMHSENDVDWGDNLYGLRNSTMDAALDAFLAASPANVKAAAKTVQIYAKQNIPYIPLYLSDDTHAIRKEWTDYVKMPGGIFTSFNKLTMIYMRMAEEPGPITITETKTAITTETMVPEVLGGVNIGWLLMVIVAVPAIFVRKRKSTT